MPRVPITRPLSKIRRICSPCKSERKGLSLIGGIIGTGIQIYFIRVRALFPLSDVTTKTRTAARLPSVGSNRLTNTITVS